MPRRKTKFCLSRADNAHFEPMHADDFMNYPDDIKACELAVLADQGPIDV